MRTAHSIFILLPLAAFACSPSGDAPAGSNPDGGAPSEDGGTVPSTCAAPTKGPTMHNSVMADETWTADMSPHILPYDTSIYAKLTLEPCAEVRIGAGRTISVNAKGSIVGDGTPANRILIAAQDEAKGWARISAVGGTVHLAYATIQGGGDPQNTRPVLAGMLYGQVGGAPLAPTDPFSLQHVTLKDSKSNGVLLTGDARFSDDSTDLVVTGSANYPIGIFPRMAGSVPPGTYTGNATDEILFPGSGGTEVIVADQTFHDRGVPYHVGIDSTSGELRVGASSTSVPLATLTIEPGVTIRFKKGGYFEVEVFSGTNPATGALIAKGTADKPILFTSGETTPAPGDWVGVSFGSATNPKTVLDHVEVQYAGLTTTGGSLSCALGLATAAISIFGQPGNAFITNSKVAHSTAGINSGWRGTQIDFTATNTFEDVLGCKLTNPPDMNNSCAGRPPCAVP